MLRTTSTAVRGIGIRARNGSGTSSMRNAMPASCTPGSPESIVTVGRNVALLARGPIATHELSHLIISKVAVGPMDNNAYLLRCRATDTQVLIDAADDPKTLKALIGDGGLERVITTHQHGDHWQALAAVVAETDAITVAGKYDAEGIPVPTDEFVDDGDVIRFGECQLEERTLCRQWCA